MTILLAVLVGGFVGALTRQEAFSRIQERAHTRFPVGILVVNLSGAFVLGLLFGLDAKGHWPPWLAAGVQTGIIGAYTTYSTWAVDSLALARGGARGQAAVNLVGSLLAGVLLVWAGASLAQAVLRLKAALTAASGAGAGWARVAWEAFGRPARRRVAAAKSPSCSSFLGRNYSGGTSPQRRGTGGDRATALADRERGAPPRLLIGGRCQRRMRAWAPREVN